MKINDDGLNLVKNFEGCRLVAYLDPVGVWTIGYGHTNGVYSGQRITSDQAEQLLRTDLGSAEKAVSSYDHIYNWNENEFSALVSFAFNCGSGSLKKLLKSGSRTKAEIAKCILLYNKGINGKTLAGLTNRRRAERELFLKTAPNPQPTTSNGLNEASNTSYGYVIDAVYEITASSLNFRNAPVDGSIRSSHRKGTLVTVREVRKIGSQIWARTDGGWICAQGKGIYIKLK